MTRLCDSDIAMKNIDSKGIHGKSSITIYYCFASQLHVKIRWQMVKGLRYIHPNMVSMPYRVHGSSIHAHFWSQITARMTLLGVTTSIGVGGLLDTGGDANTVLVASRVLNPSRGPDGPGSVNAVGASNQVLVGKLKVSLLDGPPLALGVLGCRLGARRVSDLALAC